MRKLLILLGAIALTFTLASAEMKCGQGKCGDSQKSEKKCDSGKSEDSQKGMMNNNGKCGNSQKGTMNNNGKCGDSDRDDKKSVPEKGKCGKGKCGE